MEFLKLKQLEGINNRLCVLGQTLDEIKDSLRPLKHLRIKSEANEKPTVSKRRPLSGFFSESTTRLLEKENLFYADQLETLSEEEYVKVLCLIGNAPIPQQNLGPWR